MARELAADLDCHLAFFAGSLGAVCAAQWLAAPLKPCNDDDDDDVDCHLAHVYILAGSVVIRTRCL
jgi:hypothetical protein